MKKNKKDTNKKTLYAGPGKGKAIAEALTNFETNIKRLERIVGPKTVAPKPRQLNAIAASIAQNEKWLSENNTAALKKIINRKGK